MYLNFITFFSIFSLLFIFFCRRNNFFVDYKLEKHKRFSSKFKSNSIGGILLAIFFIYYYSLKQIDYIFLTFLISILVIGIMSDIKKLNNVGLRFFLQLILIIFFIKILGLEIRTTKIDFIDTILSNTYVNILFVTFCLMVLINGGNFIDGLNGLLLKYYLLIFVLIFLNFNHYQTIDENFLINLIFVLIILLLFNSFGFIYMGDAGAYVLSLFVGIYLIDFSFDNTFISPYFVILLLWYPCFELLFSMIRRSKHNEKTYKPDALHLHQIIYNSFKSKIKLGDLMAHFLSSFIINLYNLIIFLFALNYLHNSEILIFLIFLNIVFYLLLYNFLKKSHKIKS